ncbi:unnamed protein product [Cuscuta campestris]|uniref:DOG1 domain-containing protein n=1 Tax=Cuscuta campestris TaxID=132261 RepID=A0A484MAB1_9ASTE|nr:unnamed protein product [Cuscuta campestris]
MVSYDGVMMTSMMNMMMSFSPTMNVFCDENLFHQMNGGGGGWEETLMRSGGGGGGGGGDTDEEVIHGENACFQQLTQLQPTAGTDDYKSEYTSSDSAAVSAASWDNQTPLSIADRVQRRLAQNREAARKSRLRKKAYVQQLETSRKKLTQLELELHKARQQGLHILGATRNIALCGAINPGIAAFEMEYAQWVEEQQMRISQLRNALHANAHDAELQLLVANALNHHYGLFQMKAGVGKADIFYLISGMWQTPIERFLLWLGGYKPSEFINVILPQIAPLNEEQFLSVYDLQLSCQQAEDALNQGMDKLQQFMFHSMRLVSMGTTSCNTQLVSALEKLQSLETLVNQADNLRQQTLQQMCRILTTRQAARGLIAFGDFFQHLRELSSIWVSRPYGI